MKALKFFWGLILYFWQLPQNVLGLLVADVTDASTSTVSKYNKAKIWLTKSFPGVSLGRNIIVHNRYSDYKENERSMNTIKHEYGHCRQSLILGWLYLPVIGLFSGVHNLVHQFGWAKGDYYKYWCEQWADKLGGVIR